MFVYLFTKFYCNLITFLGFTSKWVCAFFDFIALSGRTDWFYCIKVKRKLTDKFDIYKMLTKPHKLF